MPPRAQGAPILQDNTTRILAVTLGLAILSGCSADLGPAEASAELLVVHGPVTADATASAVFLNQFGRALEASDLECVVEYDRLDLAGWRPLNDAKVCRAFARIVARGDSLAFTIHAPSTAGTYRIRTSGTIADDDPSGFVHPPAQLVSAPFAVMSPGVRNP